MGGQKMAKRDGNIATPAEVYAAGFSARALRYALISAHYRAPLDFGDESLPAATAAVERLSTLLGALDAYRQDQPDDPTLPALLAGARAAFGAAMDDDLNIAPALGALFDLVRELNRRIDSRVLSSADAATAAAFMRDLDRVLAVAEPDPADLPADLAALLAARAGAREARDWATSDRLRDELAARAVLVEDSRDGQRWHWAAMTTDART
jgi:cysteinyl-tRNA synthetase